MSEFSSKQQPSSFEFATTKRIVSEPGALGRLVDLLSELGVSRPMTICDQGIVNSGLLDRLNSALDDSGIAHSSFDKVVADPPEELVLQAVAHAKSCQPDVIIGFGGGSSMDTAKLVALLVPGEQKLTNIYGVNQARGERLPLILIPTTAGTGSEVTPISIVTTGETTKAGVVSPLLLPDIALLDAELTLSLPAQVTAATGVDAMVHAIEAYTSKIRKNIYSDLLALQALRLLSANIRQATFHGNDLTARQNMLFGACLAGQAFANAPVGGIHALAYPLGGQFHIPHGVSNALVMPHVMRFNQPVASHLYSELAGAMDSFDCADETPEARSMKLIEALEQLLVDLKLPRHLSDLDIPASAVPGLADDAMTQTRLLVNNPRELDRKAALLIYQEAYGRPL